VIAIAALLLLGAAGLLAEPYLRGRGSRAALARAGRYGRKPAHTVAVSETGRRAPGVEAFAQLAIRLVPGRDHAKTATQLQAAGIYRQVELFLALKVLLAGTGLLLGGALGLGSSLARAIGLGLLFGAVGFIAPDFVVGARARKRRERVLNEFPNALDLLAVIVEAGLGLDAALMRYATRATGPLASEISLLATELRVAASRDDAFARFVDRVPSSETKSFARSVAHADRLGVSLTSTLRAQAADARFRRQAAAEERANKAPVKMLFPTVFCIFPALFVVVLGPSFISLVTNL
jgi:tight adherence protein C